MSMTNLKTIRKIIEPRHLKVCVWLLSFLSFAWAQSNDSLTPADLERYHQMDLAYVQVQIDNLNAAIELMGQRDLTNREHFELLGAPGFAAFDQAFKDHGFTTSSDWYYMASEHKAAIEQWQQAHPEHALQKQRLIETRDQLIPLYDYYIHRTPN